MRKAGLTLVALLVSLAASVPAFAVIGALDDVPAATLLLPSFEVDLNNPQGVTTLLSINNASEAPAIAHVTLWTDLSIPTMSFDVYLTGFDVHTLNLRDLFTSGVLPGTSHTNTAISNVGQFSVPTNPTSGVGPGSTSCSGLLPVPNLPLAFLVHIRSAHTGKASTVFGGQCSGANHGDTVARGYITIDNMNQCTLDFPTAPGYFATNGTGKANNVNQLWGDYFYVDPTNNFAQGLGMVHLEASNTLGAANYTFYRRYTTADQREGLPTTWASRYANGGAFDGSSELVVWRDSKRTIAPFACAGPKPAPFPLGENQIVVFDEAENPTIPSSQGPPFPWETTRTRVGDPDLPVPTNFGWIYLNLNTTVIGSQVPFEPATQSYVSIIHSALGRFSVGYSALALDNATNLASAKNVVLPVCDGAPDPSACP